MSNNVTPERLILQIARDGIAAVQANLTVLDDVLRTLTTDERAKARSLWASNPPTAVMGYARKEAAWPLWALVLSDEQSNQEYLGLGEEALLDEDEITTIGSRFKRRLQGAYTWYAFAEHPDVCAWNYRVLRRIMNVGLRKLMVNNIMPNNIRGAELAPQPELAPENAFCRILTITVEYEEDWVYDELWTAINGAPEELAHQVSVHHEDQRLIPGGIHPVTEED